MEEGNPNAIIHSIVVSRDDLAHQNLYVIYQKNINDNNSFLKVFWQEEEGKFKEFKDSDINMLELHNSIQPFFFDINGDLM